MDLSPSDQPLHAATPAPRTTSDRAGGAETKIPIHSLGDAAQIIRAAVHRGSPAVVTDGGTEVAVIVDATTFRALQAAGLGRQLLNDLELAIAEADAGDLVDHDEVMAELRGYFRGRVSPEIMRQLGDE